MSNETSTSWRFNQASWDAHDALGWLIHRNRKTFGNRLAPGDVRRAILYKNSGAAFRELLEALQRGTIKAFRDGQEIPTGEWYGHGELHHSIEGVRQSGAVFRSTDILKHWPPREPQTRIGKKRGPKPKKCNGAVQAMWEAIRSGKHTAESLRDLPEEALAAEFCGSPTARETARKARRIVLSELDGEAQPNVDWRLEIERLQRERSARAVEFVDADISLAGNTDRNYDTK